MVNQEQVAEPEIIILSAFGLPKEAVASNRIFGLATGLVSKGHRVTLITVDLPAKSRHSYKNNQLKVFAKKPPLFSYLLRKFLDSRKKTQRLSIESLETTERAGKLSLFKRALETILYLFYVGHFLPIFKLYFVASQRIKKAIKEMRPVILFASSGPGGIGLIAALLKKKYGRKLYLIQDFRDPLSNNVYIKGMCFEGAIRWVEKKIIASADLTTAVSRSVLESLIEKPKKTYVLYNGYHEMPAKKPEEIIPLSVGYFGSIYTARKKSLEALAQALQGTQFKFFYAGKNSDTARRIFEQQGSQSNFIELGFLSKEETLAYEQKMQILLVLKADEDRGVFTGKFFEYLNTEKPILVIGNKDSEFNEIAEKLGGVFIVPPEASVIKETLFVLKNTASVKRNEKEVQSFDWKNLAERFYREVLLELVAAPVITSR
jgi:hypothetical protein